MVEQGRHSDTNRLDLRQHVAIIRKPAAIKLVLSQRSTLSIRIGNANQIRIFQKTEHTGVMPTHVADSDHSDLYRNHRVGHRMECRSHRIIGDQQLGPLQPFVTPGMTSFT